MFNSHGGASVGGAYPTLHLGVRELFDQGHEIVNLSTVWLEDSRHETQEIATTRIWEERR